VTSAVEWCLEVMGYQFADEELLTRALTHRSASSENNERLEFLGDALLGLTIGQAIFIARPDVREGGLTRIRSNLVRQETLADVARELDLGSKVVLGTGERQTGGQKRTSVLANALEAVFGSILLDGGFDAVNQVVLRVFAERLQNLPDAGAVVDAKTRLQEYLHGRHLKAPVYSVKSAVGAAHAKTFEILCRVPELELAQTGSGTSRRRAEQAAAARMLDILPDG
jgi:ribonuclease-3